MHKEEQSIHNRLCSKATSDTACAAQVGRCLPEGIGQSRRIGKDYFARCGADDKSAQLGQLPFANK